MSIQASSACSSAPLLNLALSRQQNSVVAATTASTGAANSADRATISNAGRALLAATSDSAKPAAGGATALLDTDRGALVLNIDDYFSPPAQTGGAALTLPPLLLPSRNNIDALSRRISAAMPQLLAQNQIPAPPASISYDREGKLQLPADYAYAEAFKAALAKQPALARELSTVNALTSHWVEMQKSLPFQQEYAAATSQSEANAVVAKYSYLFSEYRHYAAITLQFSAQGALTLTADGKPLG